MRGEQRVLAPIGLEPAASAVMRVPVDLDDQLRLPPDHVRDVAVQIDVHLIRRDPRELQQVS